MKRGAENAFWRIRSKMLREVLMSGIPVAQKIPPHFVQEFRNNLNFEASKCESGLFGHLMGICVG
jgi:hypothetical protein